MHWKGFNRVYLWILFWILNSWNLFFRRGLGPEVFFKISCEIIYEWLLLSRLEMIFRSLSFGNVNLRLVFEENVYFWQQGIFFNSVPKSYLVDKYIQIQKIVSDPADALHSKVRCFKERISSILLFLSSTSGIRWVQENNVFWKLPQNSISL